MVGSGCGTVKPISSGLPGATINGVACALATLATDNTASAAAIPMALSELIQAPPNRPDAKIITRRNQIAPTKKKPRRQDFSHGKRKYYIWSRGAIFTSSPLSISMMRMMKSAVETRSPRASRTAATAKRRDQQSVRSLWVPRKTKKKLRVDLSVKDDWRCKVLRER